jgi:hypothetical protein
VLFTMDAWPGLASGAITVTFRAWTRPQVKVGGRYKVAEVLLLVDEVRPVRVGDINDADARKAGAADAAAIVARLTRKPRGRYTSSSPARVVDADTEVWRVAFHRVEPDGPDLAAQDELGEEDLAALDRRLDRLDAASSHGPWTRSTLALIAEQPGVVSTALAETLGREREPFKVDVRKLKRLGLTESLEVGYRLSPRGRAYLAARPSPK